jgi:hypothetical protein
MPLGWIVSGLSGAARRGGPWKVLRVMAEGRARVRIDRENNQGTLEIIRALPDGATLRETRPGGWSREIWSPPAGGEQFLLHLSPGSDGLVAPDVDPAPGQLFSHPDPEIEAGRDGS